MTTMRSSQFWLVVAFTFILFAMPRLNLRVGPIPVYMIDVVAALMVFTMFNGKAAGPHVKLPFKTLVAVILGITLFSELAAVLYGASPLDAVYISVRYALAFGMIAAVPYFIRTPDDVAAVLKAVALGVLVTSILMITSSLPPTRSIAAAVFSISILEPAGSISRILLEASETGMRGRSLIGVSILSGAFISIGWPLIAYLRTSRFSLSPLWTSITLASVMLAPLAIIVSYSRQAALGAIMVILAALLLPYKGLKRSLLQPILVTLLFVSVVGAGSSLFFFDRFTSRFESMLTDPLADDQETHRLLCYVAPFEHLEANPQFLFFGAGSNNLRSSGFAVTSFEENHCLFGAKYYAHGMIATFGMIFLVIGAFRYANIHRKRSRFLPLAARGWPRSLFLAYLPFIIMALVAPALGTTLRALYIYGFVVGLLVTLRNPALLAALGDVDQTAPTEQKPVGQPARLAKQGA